MIWVLVWYLWREPCAVVEGSLLIMECQSTGMVSQEEYRGARTVVVDVKAGPIGTGESYWAGLAFNSDIPGDTSYVQAAVTRGIEPYTSLQEPRGVKLATTGRDCCQVLGEAATEAWHRLYVSYDGRQATICVNGECSTTPWQAKDYRLELLCVADNPGTANSGGLTRCEYKGLSFLTYLPSVAQ